MTVTKVVIDGVEYKIKKVSEKFLILQKPDGKDWSLYGKLADFWENTGRLEYKEEGTSNASS